MKKYPPPLILLFGAIVLGLVAVAGLNIEAQVSQRTAGLHMTMEDIESNIKLPHVEVRVSGPEPCQSETDEFGRCTFRYLSPGTYVIETSHAGYWTLTDTLELRANTSTSCSYELLPRGRY